MKCGKGHTWVSTFNTVFYHNCWCPTCYHRKLNIQDMKDCAATRGGKCLSSEYVNCRTKLKWKCLYGHEWESMPNSVLRGSWCPHCKKSIHEHKCRFIFEQLFGVPFKNTFTVLPNKLELDGYNEQLKLAFEYNGLQHYKRVPQWQKTENAFLLRKQMDSEKEKLCKEMGITLIVIPYTVSKNDSELLSFIKEQLHKTKIIIPNDMQNLNDFNLYFKNMDGMEEFVQKQEGILLSSSHANGVVRIRVQCKYGHEWESNYHAMKRKGNWCPACSHKKTASKQIKHDTDSINTMLQSKGITCATIGMLSTKAVAKFICKNRHVWSAKIASILQGAGCPYCRRVADKIKMLEKCKILANSNNGKCLSKKYIDLHSEMTWRCKNRHEWSASYTKMNNRTHWCLECER